ncbi:hypothetical protein VDGE_03353 [Verticillium dahliae]|uniref:SET domain-containing protein n=1 Tax=Verticillium dahliae TaxID=27337 RepID=A0A444RY60_VERDA|nr:hypothetical protein VDGE_03353 [Verticillium dahliae]
MTTPEQSDSLRESLSRVIMDHLAELDWGAMGLLSNPVLRVEAFLQDGDALPATNPGPSNMNPVVSKTVDLSGYMSPMVHTPSSHAATMMPEHVPSPTSFSHHPPDHTAHMDQMIMRHRTSPPVPVPGSVPLDDYSAAANDFRRKGTGGLRLARPADGPPVQHGPDSQRQMQIVNNFPKRAKVQSDSVVFVPQQSSLDKFVVSIWDQIHGGINLEPQSLLEQWQLTASAATATINNGGRPPGPGQPDLGLLSPPPTTTDPSLATLDTATFNRSNLFCRKVTQASRACRAIEVIVQARWIEHFDAHVEVLAITSPALSPTKRRKAALLEACADFGWSEKELRNKMAIWRGYKEIKDAGGWAALVFAGMGLYRFCKYRVGFTPESMARLRALRPRIEVAADTLHPTWRQLLMIVGESPQRRFCGHPHDWVVRQDGSDPVPLRSTYLEHDPFFSFEHLDGSVVDANAWGPEDDPRWIPPVSAAASLTGQHVCHSCGQEQSEEPKVNSCYCFPSLFGSGRRSPCPVQVFRTTDGRNNGLLALCAFERGAAIGEFVGLVTKDLQNLDVMDSSTGVRGYQIWQGRQGNYTRFTNHSCKANAQFQHFVWMSTQRIILVSKGIEAGHEITVDYSGSYWRGLDKDCLCGEACCRYKNSSHV